MDPVLFWMFVIIFIVLQVVTAIFLIILYRKNHQLTGKFNFLIRRIRSMKENQEKLWWRYGEIIFIALKANDQYADALRVAIKLAQRSSKKDNADGVVHWLKEAEECIVKVRSTQDLKAKKDEISNSLRSIYATKNSSVRSSANVVMVHFNEKMKKKLVQN